MMKFAEIIKWAGFIPAEFPNASEIPTHYFDGKNRESEATLIKFARNLFEENESSKEKFSSLLNRIESEAEISEITAKIDEFSVIIKVPFAPLSYIFTRIPAVEFD